MQDVISGYPLVMTIDGLENKILKAMGESKKTRKQRKIRRASFVTIINKEWVPPVKNSMSELFVPNIDIYKKTK